MPQPPLPGWLAVAAGIVCRTKAPAAGETPAATTPDVADLRARLRRKALEAAEAALDTATASGDPKAIALAVSAALAAADRTESAEQAQQSSSAAHADPPRFVIEIDGVADDDGAGVEVRAEPEDAGAQADAVPGLAH